MPLQRLAHGAAVDAPADPLASGLIEVQIIPALDQVLFPILIRKPPAIFAGSLPPVMSFSGEGKG
jgi:hypothetical protein